MTLFFGMRSRAAAGRAAEMRPRDAWMRAPSRRQPEDTGRHPACGFVAGYGPHGSMPTLLRLSSSIMRAVRSVTRAPALMAAAARRGINRPSHCSQLPHEGGFRRARVAQTSSVAYLCGIERRRVVSPA